MDKTIGIKLDVKQTGLKPVEEALDAISKNVIDLNKSSSIKSQKGWGSESLTKELREQLRYMQEMLGLSQRMERLSGSRGPSGISGASTNNPFPENRTPAEPNIPSRNRETASHSGNLVKSMLTIGIATSLMSSVASGLNKGDQLTYGFSDLSKSVNHSVNPLTFRSELLRKTRGLGFSEEEQLQTAKGYASVTGKATPYDIATILRTGRNYGMGSSAVTDLFAQMAGGGVTNGSTAQLSPQDFAKLFANAMDQGKMSGKSEQMASQLQQIVQMNVGMTGQAGDIKQLSGFLSLINSTGNQGLINNIGSITGGLNNMIANPGGGFAGQAFTIQALQAAHPGMGYSQLMDLASQGISNPDNIRAILDKVSKTGGSKYDKSLLMSRLGFGNQHMATTFLESVMNPDGSYNQKAIDDFAKNSTNSKKEIPLNDIDKARERSLATEHAQNDTASKTLEGRSYIKEGKGSVVDLLGSPLAYASEIGVGGMLATKGISWILKKMGINWTKGASGAAAVEGGGSGGSLLGGLGSIGLSIGIPTILGTFMSNHILKEEEKKKEQFRDTFKNDPYMKNRGSQPLYKSNVGSGSYVPGQSSSSSPQPPLTDEEIKGMQNYLQQSTPGGITKSSYNPLEVGSSAGSQLAPIVASTIVALGPYMSQIKSTLGESGGSSHSSDLVYRGDGFRANDIAYHPMNSTGGIRLAGFGTGGGGTLTKRNFTSGGSFSGATADFVNKMMPYAKQASQSTGLPVEFILGQWGHESGWGTSSVSQTNNNFAGIKPWSGAGAGSNKMYAGFNSLSDFASGYSDFMLKNERYKGLLDAARKGASDDSLADIMQGTGYAEDPEYGRKLSGTIRSAQNAIKVTGEATINVKQPDGSTDKVKITLTPLFPA